MNELKHKNFAYEDVVIIKNTGSADLDGKQGYISGVASRGLIDVYIVDLSEVRVDVAENRLYHSVVMTEHCIELFEG